MRAFTATLAPPSFDAVVLALPRPVERAQLFDVRAHVVAWIEQRANAQDLFRVVQVDRHDRNAAGFGDLPEADLPARHRLARALRRQRVPQALVRGEEFASLLENRIARVL